MRGKRVSVTLTEAQARVVERLSKANRVSQSRVIGELVEAVEPVLVRVATLCEFAERAKGETAAKLAESMEEAQAELEPVLLRAMRVLGMEPTLPGAPGSKRASAEGPGSARQEGMEREANPRLVTRGLGMGSEGG